MESESVSLPLIHEHQMMPWNDLRKGDCCGLFESVSDGYYCKICDYFVHKKCGDEVSEFIDHPSHPNHSLRLGYNRGNTCDLCGRIIESLSYGCDECHVDFHVKCVCYPAAADLNHPTEVNHSYHPLHPLMLLRGEPPEYSNGRCCLCGKEIDEEFFYHCSSCNFTLDIRCILNPPPQYLIDLKAHDHQLTLFPRLDSFTCNACGIYGVQSPYICAQCGFVIHQDCLGLPRVIKINRHDHRLSRTSVLGVMNSSCSVCRKKVDWTRGGFSCQRCPRYVVHSKCATSKDIWSGKELEGVPEEEDMEPEVVIDDNTIQHFSHKEHCLKLHMKGILFLYEDNKWCRACTHPIGLQSYYGCMDCEFSLHVMCANCPRKISIVLHNESLTLFTNEELDVFSCYACGRASNGFMYKHGDMKLDVFCSSISEPFLHPSHPTHPLYYIPTEIDGICNGCRRQESYVLRCIEDDCEFVLGFKCATLPQVVKHIDDDDPLSLCYGKEEARGKYWCDICEKETNPKDWFYTCKDQHASLHTYCVLGDLSGLMPGSVAKLCGKSFEVVLNDSETRPFCNTCKSRCMYPIYLKLLGTSEKYICSFDCTVLFCLSSHQ